MGTLCAESGEESAKCGASLAKVSGQCSDSGEYFVCTVGTGCFEWVDIASLVSSNGHDCVVEPLLYDSPVGGVLWTSRAVVVAGARAWQCNGGIR